MIDAVYIIGAFLISIYLCLKVRWLCEKNGMFNEINERSSHKKPTLRGGGLGIVLVVIPSLFAIIYFTNTKIDEYLLALAFSSIVIAIMGWLDDIKPRPALLRFFIQFVCVGICLYFIPQVFDFIPIWLEKIILALAWVWFINLYNFMDGIDGYASAQGVFIAFALSLVFMDIKIIALVVVGACIGFLRLNWHPAKIFLGDVGSTFLGFLLAGLIFINLNTQTILPLLTITLLFSADATYTLIKRLIKGHKPWQAHREHLYQCAISKAGLSHSGFVIRAMGINIILLILFVVGLNGFAVSSFIAGLITVVLFAWRMKYLEGK